MDVHLKFLAFLLQDGALYMPTKRASEVWDTLISNPEACVADREVRDFYDYVCECECECVCASTAACTATGSAHSV